MASRYSPFHTSLHRSRVIMGVERASFGAICFVGSFCFVAQSYWALPGLLILFWIARWLTKKDDQFVGVLLRYLDEGHVYDSIPRNSDLKSRPKGWGRGLPF